MTDNRILSTLADSAIAGKNLVINGGMDIWQRGVSFSQVSGYCADRWYINASTTTTITRDASVVTPNSQYSLKATATGTQQIFLYQAIETSNVINLAGKTVTLSAYVAGSSGNNTNINLSLAFSTSTDNAVTGTFTDITPISAGNITTTTTMQRVSAVFAVPSTAKSLRLLLVNNAANITVGQALYFGDIQLELGSVATQFSRAGGTIQGELAACQRYYEAQIGNMGFVGSIGNGIAYYAFGRFQVQKRSTSNVTIATTGVSGFPASNAIAEQINTSGFRTYLVSNASTSNGFYINNWTADCEL